MGAGELARAPKVSCFNLKNAVEQAPLISISRKERKERKEGMFLLIIHAVYPVWQFTQLVKTKNRSQIWIIRNTQPIIIYFAIFAFFAAKS